MNIKRVSYYAWKQSNNIAKNEGKGFGYRLRLYFDMICCFLKYRMWTNQYVKETFWTKNKEEREVLGAKYKEEGIKRDAWQKDFRANRKFLIKYANIKYEKASLRAKRNKAYTEKFHAGKNLFVEYDVNISRQHYLDGSITIGDNVLLSKHVTIDYSGDVVIMDNVKISDGVIIESHSHQGFASSSILGQDAQKEYLTIEDKAVIGAKAIILESCHLIGRNARIGAGAVVRFNVPPYAIIIGNPGKIVGFTYSPKEMKEYEEKRYSSENRTDIAEYSKNYKQYFSSRLKEIKVFTKRSL